MSSTTDDRSERERHVNQCQNDLAEATERLVHQTMVAAEEERQRVLAVQDVHEARAALDKALHALITKAAKP